MPFVPDDSESVVGGSFSAEPVETAVSPSSGFTPEEEPIVPRTTLSKTKSLFGTFNDLTRKYNPLSISLGIGKAMAQNVASLAAKPVVSMYAGITGDTAPKNIPLAGEVKPYATPESATSLYIAKHYGEDVSQEDIDKSKGLANTELGEAAYQDAMTYLDVGAPGAGRLLKKLPLLRGKQMVQTAKEGEQVAKDLLDYTMPKITAKRGKNLLAEGATEVKGKIFKTEVPKATEYNKQVAKAVEGLVDTGKTATENIHNIRVGIRDVAQKVLTPLLQADMRPFNMNTFTKRMNDIPVPRMFKTEKSVENTFNGVKDMASEIMAEFPKTREGAWKARQAFDDAVEREFPRMWDGSEKDTAIKEAVAAVRKSWNGMLSEGHPFASQVEASLDKMSKMYTAVYNISEKNASKVGMSWSKRFATEHPKAAQAVKIGAGVTAAGIVGEKAKQALGL